MRIANNIMAMNAHRQLTINQGMAAKAMERLSSGFRINRAGDDAAGLAISEKMRGQIRGLKMAQKNAQDAISLIQTAEGALQESHAILQRMRELAVQSASDTNTAVDRQEIQKEIDQLAQELSRIGNTTEFNTQKLLNGTFEGTFHIGANENQNLTVAIGDMRGFALGVAGSARYEATGTVSGTVAEGIYTVAYDGAQYVLLDNDGLQVATSNDGLTYNFGASGTIVFTDPVVSGTITVADDSSSGLTATATSTVINQGLQSGVYTVADSGDSLVDSNGTVVATWDTTSQAYVDAAGNVLLKPAAQFTIDGMEINVGGIDVSSQQAANKAITTIQQALEKVSSERSKLGAYQNRLEHTIANLGVSAENLQAAESRIRDVDMAAEMMSFTKYQILQQASTAMLAQANLAPQSVLQLLG